MSKKVLFGLGAVVVTVAGVVIYKKVTKNNEVDEDQEISDLLAENEEIIDAVENMILEEELDDDGEDIEDDNDDVELDDFASDIKNYFLRDLIDCVKDEDTKNSLISEYTDICFEIVGKADASGREMRPTPELIGLKERIKDIIKAQ